ncbi:BTAD domain-containing putative transcriptional regulator [Quatrionicoccus australiensis]|uniref:BTAD domain-containing putative transcriptional regulator n=1 Tax=Quatrionicoccus australiensis TaxID=138118 RepID=UPI001CFAED0D|nr:BTAD domain-containing putative transcriptional regulator [Quatrionicoccus australiensis]MCB4358595.1 AAA family ATPase [Quatrionicoccus australiensis]
MQPSDASDNPGPDEDLLTLRLFGGFSALRGQQPLPDFAYDKVRALLAYLAIEAERAHSRAHLADLFWPDADHDTARNNLRHALFNLRKVLGKDSTVIVHEGRQALRFASAHPLDLDFRRFNATRSDQHGFDSNSTEEQVALFRGPLLDRLHLPDAPEFEQWLCQRQEAALRRALQLHQQLVDHYMQSGRTAHTLHHMRRQVALAPWQEAYRQQLMQYLAENGKTAEALLEYEACRSYLEKEVGILPDPATESLASRIREKGHALPTRVQPVAKITQQRLPVTVLVCHLHPRQLLHPDDIHEALMEPRARCRQAIGEQGGHCVELHAGSLSAYFGYPNPQERAPRRALKAAIAIARELAAQTALEFSLGLHCGWMLADSTYALPDVAGQISRHASFLASQGKPGQITVSREIVAATEGYFCFADYLAGDGNLYSSLTGKTDAFDRIEATREAARSLTPLVGRQAELKKLLDDWHGSAGQSRTVIVQGEAGIGKSRLMRAAIEQILKTGALHIDLRCQPDYQQTPYFPLSDFVQRRFRIPPDASDEIRISALQHGIFRDRPELVRFIPTLCALLNLPSELDTINDHFARRSALEHGLLECIKGLAGQHPVLLTLEDAHWAGPSTLDFLTRAIAAPGGPRLWLMTSRDAAIVTGASTLALGHLNASLACDLANRVVGAGQLPPEQIAGIVARADGMPLYIEQMVRSALDNGCTTIPLNLTDLLASRLEALGSYQRLAQYAAVIGREFDREMLEYLWDEGSDSLTRGLEKMAAAQLLQQEMKAHYAFRHALIRDAAYITLPAPARRAIHAQLAETLGRHFAKRVADHPELLAHHLDAAEHPDAAAAWLRSGMHAAARSVQQEAVVHFRRGLAKLHSVNNEALRHDLEFRLNIHLGNALIALEGYGSTGAQQAYARAQGLSTHISNDSELFQLMWGLWLGGRSTTGETPPLALTEKLRAIAAQSTDPCTPVMLNYAYGNNYFWMGQPARAREHLEQAIAAAAHVDSREMIARYGEDGGVTSRAFLAWVLWIEGEPVKARAMCEASVALARQTGHAHSLGFALAFAGVLHRHFDLPGEALAYGQELAALAEKNSLLLWQAVGATVLGWATAVGGEAAGLEYIRMGIAGARQAMLIVETTFLSFLADGLFRLGQHAEADEILDECIAKAVLREDTYFLGEFHRLKGEIMLATASTAGKSEADAEQAFTTGLQIAERQGARLLALRLASSQARLWQQQGKTAAAAQLLGTHLAGFAEGHDYPDLRKAHAVHTGLLASLA